MSLGWKQADNTLQHLQSSVEPLTRAIPRITFKEAPCLTDSNETFRIDPFPSELRVTTASKQASLFGRNVAQTYASAGHAAERYGLNTPNFACRPLWIIGKAPVSLAPGLMAAHNIVADPAASAKRVVEMGYNTVIFGGRENSISGVPIEATKQNLQAFVTELKKLSVHIWIKPTAVSAIPPSPLLPEWRAFLQTSLNAWFATNTLTPDRIVWRSLASHPEVIAHPSSIDATSYDLLHREMALLESVVQKRPLLFALPPLSPEIADYHATIIDALSDDAGDFTTIAFPMLSGNLTQIHRPHHAIWNTLRQSPDTSATPLLPFVNVGGIGVGESLWPSLPTTLINSTIGRMTRHNFMGAITATPLIPSGEGILACALWCMGQALWYGIPSETAAETWFRANHPSIDAPYAVAMLAETARLVAELTAIRALPPGDPDRFRSRADMFLAILKEAKYVVDSHTTPLGFVADAFTYFARDARRLLCDVGSRFSVSLNSLLTPDDLKEGFWTKPNGGGGGIVLLKDPEAPPAGTPQLKIFNANRCI